MAPEIMFLLLKRYVITDHYYSALFVLAYYFLLKSYETQEMTRLQLPITVLTQVLILKLINYFDVHAKTKYLL